jgi:hypothetical protein
MWDSAAPDDQEDEGLATAQTILSAAEISLPSGNLVNGVYDSLGNYYQIPEWVVCDPDNIVEEDRLDTKGDVSNAGDETAGEDEEDLNQNREDRGKAVVDVREQIAVRARLSENGRDVVVNISKHDTVKTLGQRIAEESGVSLSPTSAMQRSIANHPAPDARHQEDSHGLYGQNVEGKLILGISGLASWPCCQRSDF